MTPFFKNFLEGLVGAVIVIAVLLVLLSASGCASMPEYVNASPEERAACAGAQTGCTLWTDAEIKAFAQAMFKAGFERGVKHERSSL